MNVVEIATRVKRTFGDESGAEIEDADIIRWVNDAQLDIVRKTHCLSKSATTASVIGTPESPLPADFLLSRELKFGGRMLSSIPLEEFNYRYPNREEEDPTGTPEYFTVRGRNFLLYPAPDTVGDIVAFYVARPTLLTTVSEVPEIPIDFHEALVKFALMRAKELDEDWQAAERFQGQYNEDVSLSRSDTQWPDASTYPVVRDYEDW